jgi:hypothetical protein
MRKRKRTLPEVGTDVAVQEDLPFPWVHYPGLYGTFMGFSQSPDAEICLCACTAPLVQNYLRLRQVATSWKMNALPERRAPLAANYFPEPLIQRSRVPGFDPTKDITFHEGLCHRCNLATPSLRWENGLSGVSFRERFGWYINQLYLQMGVMFWGMLYLPEVCPPDLQVLIDRCQADRLRIQAAIKQRQIDESNPWISRLKEPDRQATLNRRAVIHYAENLAREEFGFRRVGDGWVSETTLAGLVQQLYPKQPLERHYRPDWLEGLELDVFLPKLGLAFEYQGQQHFISIPAWGGEEALLNLKKRDDRKARICARLGVVLVLISFREALTLAHIRYRIRAARTSSRAGGAAPRCAGPTGRSAAAAGRRCTPGPAILP